MSKSISDALLAELLGDVGSLHDSIKALPASLKSAVAPSVIELVASMKSAQEGLQAEILKSSAINKELTDSDKKALKDEVKAILRQEIKGQSKVTQAYIWASVFMAGTLCGILLGSFIR